MLAAIEPVPTWPSVLSPQHRRPCVPIMITHTVSAVCPVAMDATRPLKEGEDEGVGLSVLLAEAVMLVVAAADAEAR